MSEEKNEKKELLSKFTNLQSELTDKIETFSSERVLRAKRYYIILGICIVLLLALGALVFTPLLLPLLQS